MASSSGIWTIENVAARFQEAVSTGRRLPPVRVKGYFNSWPAIARQEWERLAADDRPVHRFPPDPAAIDRMVETMRWSVWLEEDARHLVWMRAEERKWREVCQRFGCDRSTAWRHWQRSLETVASHLNQK